MRRTFSPAFWRKQRVVVTGATGFLGSHIVSLLTELRPRALRRVTHDEYDLRTLSACKKAVVGADIVIHAAGEVGGIGRNEKFPATLFDDNLLMGMYITQAAYRAGVRKLVHIGTVCSYPKYTPVPFSERNFWDGYPEETNAAYGVAKKSLLVQAHAYRQQYGFPIIYLIPVNLYGPGDSYHPQYAHVIPSLIRKMRDAKKRRAKTVVLWGTGLATREFLYVGDAARAIMLAAQQYDRPDPVNIGSGSELSIRMLASEIARLVGFVGDIRFDGRHPDGQPKRLLDSSLASTAFGFRAGTKFRTGLNRTVSWYLSTYP